jgi:hypothetical protein
LFLRCQNNNNNNNNKKNLAIIIIIIGRKKKITFIAEEIKKAIAGLEFQKLKKHLTTTNQCFFFVLATNFVI